MSLRLILAVEGLRDVTLGRASASREASITAYWDGSKVRIELVDEDTRGPGGLSRDRFVLQTWTAPADPQIIGQKLKEAFQDSRVTGIKQRDFEWKSTKAKGVSAKAAKAALLGEGIPLAAKVKAPKKKAPKKKAPKKRRNPMIGK
tara:strand:- start:207 stop:644 length:438 start_codon:yes stop_codon:yes gene_type:complete